MQFIDLAAQQERIRPLIEERIKKVLAQGQYIMGPEVQELEKALAAYVGAKHALACASGTDALLLALLVEGIGPGDVVFTTPFTFIATAEVVSLLGATSIFVDIDPVTFNLDPVQLEQAVQALSGKNEHLYPLPKGAKAASVRARAVIPVDLFGLPADYDALEPVARKFGLRIIEDAAQSLGGESGGKKACAFGDIACTSFFPAKPLGCYGDGGMCFTDSDQAVEIMRSLRVHGQGSNKYDNVRIGINGRLDTLQAAILIAKLSIFEEEIELRQQVAARYTSALLESRVTPPRIPERYKSAWAQYSVLARDESHRSELQTKLKDVGIPTAIYYPKSLH
ncbi:MAG: DegT/DnrJ/EryC1/StrS family aminotransferase, partial [Syntrophales bacterium LBB04]|nr:DegT/DnrJ/EryC1/StrS family aminotransferase [Syntrophales bacterium LBB04]